MSASSALLDRSRGWRPVGQAPLGAAAPLAVGRLVPVGAERNSNMPSRCMNLPAPAPCPPPAHAAAPRKRSRLEDQGRGRKSSAAVVAPSKQIKVADSELLTDWERKRQVGVRWEGGPVQAVSCGEAVIPGGFLEVFFAALWHSLCMHPKAACYSELAQRLHLPTLPVPVPQEYKQRKRLGGSREKETLARLAKFKQVQLL